MDIRRQTAQELQGGSNVVDGRPSSGGQVNRLSAINQQIGRVSLPSGTAAADSLAALAARNDMAVGGGPSRTSLRSRNAHSVTFNQVYSESSKSALSGQTNVNSNVSIPVPSGPSSLQGNIAEPGILDISGGVIEPLDYEEYVQQQKRAYGNVSGRVSTTNQRSQGTEGGSISEDRVHLMDFPADDIEVNVVPRKIRTVQHVVPNDEPM